MSDVLISALTAAGSPIQDTDKFEIERGSAPGNQSLYATGLQIKQYAGGVQSVVAGTNVTVNNADPFNPIVSATSGGVGRVIIKKTADEARTSNTVLTNDSTLVIAIPGAGTYLIHGVVFYTIANATEDFKYQIAFSGTNSSYLLYRSTIPAGTAAGTSAETQGIDTAAASTALLSSSAGTGLISFDLSIVATSSGTLSFQWAQNTSGVNAVTVKAGSFLEWT